MSDNSYQHDNLVKFWQSVPDEEKKKAATTVVASLTALEVMEIMTEIFDFSEISSAFEALSVDEGESGDFEEKGES